MGLKDQIEKIGHDVKDKIDEVGHRGAADAERSKRDLAGDAMTPGEKAGSLLNEGKNDVLAGVDKGKRDVRDTLS